MQAAQIGSITDEQFLAAAEALAGLNTREELDRGVIFPGIKEIRGISKVVAIAVIRQAMREGQSMTPAVMKLMPLLNSKSEEDQQTLEKALMKIMKDPGQTYKPIYSNLVYRMPGLGRFE